jgi:hypothetical protein
MPLVCLLQPRIFILAVSMGFFCSAGSYHGLDPTYRQSADYGVMHATADKQGKVTDVTIWRAGFMEEREVLVGDFAHCLQRPRSCVNCEACMVLLKLGCLGCQAR